MVCVLSATSRLGLIETGYCVHAYIEKMVNCPEADVFIGTGLIDMYSKCGCLNAAFSVFNRMKVRNVLTWTALATGLANNGRGKEAIELLEVMRYHGVNPNAVTFSSLLSACCHTGLVEEGVHLFSTMETKFGVIPQVQHYGCVVDLLGRAGYLEAAYDFVKSMPAEPDAILWRSLLSACNLHGDLKMAEKVGNLLLQRDLVPDSAIHDITQDYISISNIYAAAGKWSNVEDLRKEMKRKGGCAKHGGSSELSAMQLY
ncbi:hypothetical protein MLD38_008482 [Melastoma candidum]|uniref:Uncharacterized protein n=1 Tax=Melastoma candidum TaxID=119954 RepID=A0ACB9RUE9_9MYRT|nr:hypothetical protein MLD38_008482 [Melastoma candidum]